MDSDVIVAVTGPTACGKTTRAVQLAKAIGGEIISCDSRQVYRDMTLGTGKDLEEYGDVPYHLIDICAAGDKYNLHRFVADCESARRNIAERGRNVVLCGGTGLYLETVLSGIRLPEVPENVELRERLSTYSLKELTDMLASMKRLHNSTDVDSVKRAIRAIEIEQYYLDHPEDATMSRKENAEPLRSLIIGLDISREERRNRITLRLDERLRRGMLDEVRMLLESGLTPDDLIYYGLEYKFITLHLIGKLSYEEMRSGLEAAIHQFAKRQMTWFRGMERRGFKIQWLPYDMPVAEFIDSVKELMKHSDN